MVKPYVSVVIPVYNEQDNLEALFSRLTAAMDKTGKAWEVLFTNDGSRDRSIELLKSFQKQRPKQVRIIDFNGNFGQHMAIMGACAAT
jgi:undecaprenyl-phosphate 4-deoxy-4-formamido-L-arabinose transferase